MGDSTYRVAIIGAGAVGSAVAYTLVIKDLALEVVLIDVNESKEEGEIMDINDALPSSESVKITGGDFADASSADIIVITAGLPQKSGNQDRLELVKQNRGVLESIASKINPVKKSAIIILVSNPVDVLTYYAKTMFDLPRNQIFGTGTSLDTARLKTELSLLSSVNPQKIDGFVLGEHGESGFVAWSTVKIDGASATERLSLEEMQQVESNIRNDAKNIIDRKGATFYGIASVVGEIVESIVLNLDKAMPVSTDTAGWNGIDNVCLGIPVVIGSCGVKNKLDIALPPAEQSLLKQSAEKISAYYK